MVYLNRLESTAIFFRTFIQAPQGPRGIAESALPPWACSKLPSAAIWAARIRAGSVLFVS
jgi:hypothetical protein